MVAILKKEINSFFASSIGYLVISIFLLLNGLILWVFKGPFNIIDYGFADLSAFFMLAPWVLVFLIPAVTMRSFADEKKQGTLELLLTKPIAPAQIVLGKFFGAFLLIVMALLPTILYVYTVYKLGDPIGNLDMASVIGSYLGLLFLVAAYTAIGVFSSTLSDNQIVAFIVAVFVSLLFYIGFEGIADFSSMAFIDGLGMNSHYKSMSRGVLDTSDILYFISVSLLFLWLTVNNINRNTFTKPRIIQFGAILFGIVILNILSDSFYHRFDLTKDKRYTISDAALHTIKEVNSPIIIDVFLEGKGFPSEFRRLQTETRQLLEEFSARNKHIKFSFINPLADESTRDRNIQQLSQRGLKPMQLSVQEGGKSSQEVIFPWALASYNNATVIIPLVKNKIGATQQELVSNSVQHLEYAFADGFGKLVYPKRRKIAVLKGNNQLEDKYIQDFVLTLAEYYNIAPFTLDSVSNSPQKTLDQLKEYDLIISAKPTLAFTEREKLVLDQYTMHGGKSLWLLDAVAMDKDSLYNDTGTNIATARDLNLNDFFFKYGARINPVMVASLYSAPITLAIGEGSDSQFQHLQWPYSPLASGSNNHPIVNNLNLVRFDFASPIDTLKNGIKKTILLKSEALSKLEGTPKEISLDLVTQKPDPALFNTGVQTLAVLLEGKFTSVYNNRIQPFELADVKNTGTATKMIIVGDGDLIKNDVGRNGPLELGFDRWTGQTFGNKEFLLNAVNYLLDDYGLINIRSKDVAVAFLDRQHIVNTKMKWQLINIAIPLILLGLFGYAFNSYRRKKYAA